MDGLLAAADGMEIFLWLSMACLGIFLFLRLMELAAELAMAEMSRSAARDFKLTIKCKTSSQVHGHRDEINLQHTSNRLHLLGLPAELRNKIMEDVLVESGNIILRAGQTSQPGILRMCASLRKDYLGLYFTNQFILQVSNYDMRPFIPFVLSLRGFSQLSKSFTQFDNQPNWQNLKHWMKAVHYGNLGGLKCSISNRNDEAFAISMIAEAILANAKKVSWEKSEKTMEALRPMLIRVDQRWANWTLSLYHQCNERGGTNHHPFLGSSNMMQEGIL